MKPKCRSLGQRTLATSSLLVIVTLPLLGLSSNTAMAQDEEAEFTTDFRLADRNFKSEGENTYFVLKPGFQLVFEGDEGDGLVRFVVTVLDETVSITLPDIGDVEARVIDEKEWLDGEKLEFTRSYFAISEKTNDVFDFGDDVEIFLLDGTVSHDGSWRAGRPDDDGLAEPGIFMPGTFLLGARYFQQQADGMSTERAENVEMGLTVNTKAGTFENCVKVLETNTIESDEESEKIHCPGIGLVGEDELQLVAYGYNIVNVDDGQEIAKN